MEFLKKNISMFSAATPQAQMLPEPERDALFGETVRNAQMWYSINEELGALLNITKQGSHICIELLTKSGNSLGQSDFYTNLMITNISYNHQTHSLVFTLSDLSTLSCDISALTNLIPTKVSDLLNDLEFQTFTEVQALITEHNESTESHQDIRDAIPTAVSQLYNDSDFLTSTQVSTAIAAHHDSTKQDLINDLANIRAGAALGSTAVQPAALTNYRTAAAQDIIDSGKVDKLAGKGLSTNDYTNTDKLLVNSAVQPATLTSYRTSVAQDIIDATKVDKVQGKQLSQEDFTTSLKTKLEGLDPQACGKVVDVTKGGSSLVVNKVAIIPDSLSSYLLDSTHRLVTDSEKSTWSNKLGPGALTGYATETYVNNHHDSTKQNLLPNGAYGKYLHKNSLNGNIEWADVDAQKDTYLNDQSVVVCGVARLYTVDNLTSSGNMNPLTANMGKQLLDQINTLLQRGRFLSIWNCITGLATTEPIVNPYTYKTGDYFIVGHISSGSVNYKPNGSVYNKFIPSTTVELSDVQINDTYYFDGTTWSLLHTEIPLVAFSTIAGSPYDNTELAAALLSKLNIINLANKLSADFLSEGSTNKLVSQNEKNIWSGKQDAITVTNKLSADLLSEGTTNKLVSQTDKNTWNGKTSINDSSTSSTTETWSASKINTQLSGKQNSITSSNKLSSDLVDDSGHTNKFVTQSDKDAWNAKQPAGSYMTLNTDQTATSKKTLSYTEPIVRGGQETILNVLSTHTSDEMEAMWAGRVKIGNKNKTFLLGVYKQALLNQPAICGIGAHSWSNSFAEQGAAWEDIYLNPDGDKAVYIGDHDWRANTGWFKVQNTGTDYGGKAYCNRGDIQYPDWHEVATINDDSLYETNETWSANQINTQLSGKQPTITSSNKLSADLVSNGSTNKVVTQTEKNTWNGKSVVSVASTGSSTDEVKYITINGAEKKLSGGTQVIWRTY